MNMIKATLLAGLTILLTACESDVFDINSDPFKNEKYTNLLTSPISTTLEEDGSFTEYVKMLRYADLYNALNQCSDGVSFTAFAPNDEAMKEFYERRGVKQLEDFSKGYARAFVLYHTLPDSLTRDQFVGKTQVTNLSGDELSIRIDDKQSGEAIIDNEGQVIEMGRPAYNGKIFVLSHAMTPLVETVFDRINDSGASKIMTNAINETGWAKRLTTVTDTIQLTSLTGNIETVVRHYYYTILNVSDATFAKDGIVDLAGLKAKLKANDDRGLSEDSLLKEYIGYHVMDNSYTTSELGTMTGSNLTRIWGTQATNQVLTVSIDTLKQAADSLTINAAGKSAHFVSTGSNILSKNGYVHEIDYYLPVWNPEQSEILWDLADNSDIKNIVPIEYYQPKEKPTKEERTRIARASCFSYEMGEAGTSNYTYSDIDYVTSTLEGVNNHDRVVFNLGYMGSVSITTPTIIKGKYRVEIGIVYSTSQSFMRTQSDGNGGLVKVAFENDSTYASPYTKITSDKAIVPAGLYTSTLFDEIEFPETSTHTMRMVVLDPAASTNSKFCLQIDYLRFIPIE